MSAYALPLFLPTIGDRPVSVGSLGRMAGYGGGPR